VSDWLRDLAAKATPGPWERVIEQGDEWWFGGGNQARIRAVDDDHWGSVAVLGCDDETEQADARLIALAPDLARGCADLADSIRRVRQVLPVQPTGIQAVAVADLDAALAAFDALAPKDTA
jgi:GT2 family glycosyltransferase